MYRQPARVQRGGQVADIVGPIGELGGADLLRLAGGAEAIRDLLQHGRREGRQPQQPGADAHQSASEDASEDGNTSWGYCITMLYT